MYKYEAERPRVFSESGVVVLTQLSRNVRNGLSSSGAVRFQEMLSGVTGDTFLMLACIDYMVERGQLREVTDPAKVWGQHRVFVEGTGL